jgi:hypothetical protein
MRPFGERLPPPHSKPLAKSIEGPAPALCPRCRPLAPSGLQPCLSPHFKLAVSSAHLVRLRGALAGVATSYPDPSLAPARLPAIRARPRYPRFEFLSWSTPSWVLCHSRESGNPVITDLRDPHGVGCSIARSSRAMTIKSKTCPRPPKPAVSSTSPRPLEGRALEAS